MISRMHRRTFISLLGAAAMASPRAARAQEPRRVELLLSRFAEDSETQNYLAVFAQMLRTLGWRRGENLRVDYRWRLADDARMRAQIAETVARAPDVILAGSTWILRETAQATRTVPIIFTGVSDPVAQGIVTNLRRPGGNVTGFTSYEFAIGAKWLDLLKQIAPKLSHVALLHNPLTSPQWPFFMQSIAAAAPALGVALAAAPVRKREEIEPVLAGIAQKPNGGIIMGNDQFFNQHRSTVVAEIARHRLPAIYAQREFVNAGGLMRYGHLALEQWRGAAIYVDRILKGAKPGDLPIQQPTRYELVINMKAANALGLELPMALMLRADEVIE
jgi:putative ABC transport system substrate-binding protein